MVADRVSLRGHVYLGSTVLDVRKTGSNVLAVSCEGYNAFNQGQVSTPGLFFIIMGKKITFLILALLLPVAVFLFLKLFGRNEFRVRVLYQDAVPERAGACEGVYSAPYLVSDSIMERVARNGEDSLYVFNFDSTRADAVGRVAAQFDDDPVAFVDLTALEGKVARDFLRRCVLLMHEDSSAVIVDHHRRIRGYYDPRNRDEIDRMIVEIKIMLKQH